MAINWKVESGVVSVTSHTTIGNFKLASGNNNLCVLVIAKKTNFFCNAFKINHQKEKSKCIKVAKSSASISNDLIT